MPIKYTTFKDLTMVLFGKSCTKSVSFFSDHCIRLKISCVQASKEKTSEGCGRKLIHKSDTQLTFQ